MDENGGGSGVPLRKRHQKRTALNDSRGPWITKRTQYWSGKDD